MRNLPAFPVVLLVPLIACGAAPASTPSPAPVAASPTDERTVGATLDHQILLNPTDVEWGDGPPTLLPGAKMAVVEGDPKAPDALFTIRLKLPDGFAISPHFHPADEHITVIAGTFNMGMGDVFDKNATTALQTGSFAVMPKGHHHFAWANGETVVQVHGVGPWGITYVNSADDPRNAQPE